MTKRWHSVVCLCAVMVAFTALIGGVLSPDLPGPTKVVLLVMVTDLYLRTFRRLTSRFVWHENGWW